MTRWNGTNYKSYLPWFIAGGGAGYLKTGQAAHIPATDLRNVLCTVAAAMGVTLGIIGGANVSPVEELRA